MKDKVFKYHISGYVFETNIFFPELEQALTKADCSIFVGKNIPCSIPKEALELASYVNTELGLRCIKFFNFGLVAIWGKIKFEFYPFINLTEAQIRLHILGSVSMIVATTKGYTCFHGSAVILNGKAVLFCANSGFGKSSIAAFFYTKGYPVLSDDVVNVKVEKNGKIYAFPSVPRIKLDEEGIARINISSHELEMIPTPRIKYSLPIFQTHLQPSYELSAMVLLDFTAKTNNFTKTMGISKIRAISRQLFLKRNINFVGETINKNNVIFTMVQKISVFEFNQIKSKELMEQNFAFLEKELLNHV